MLRDGLKHPRLRGAQHLQEFLEELLIIFKSVSELTKIWVCGKTSEYLAGLALRNISTRLSSAHACGCVIRIVLIIVGSTVTPHHGFHQSRKLIWSDSIHDELDGSFDTPSRRKEDEAEGPGLACK